MGRRTFSKPKSQNIPTKQKQTPQQVINQQPTVMGTIGQGMSLGAGAAIGSSMVHGAMGAFSPNQDKMENQDKIENQDKMKNSECDNFFNQFKLCSQNYEDLNTCKPFLHFYTTCINANSSVQHPDQ